jgi:hypothetical protein
MADIPTELTQSITLIDPKTGTGTIDLLQFANALVRYLRALNERVTDLE